jgi:hypothetical protein
MRCGPIALSLSPCQPLQGSSQPTDIVFDGNSLTAGLGASPGNSYPEQAMRLLPRSYTWHNLGVSAQTTVQMAADAADQVDALVDPSARNVLVVWEATNDLFFGAGPEAAYGHLVSYCQDRRRAGYQVIVLTLLPRSEPGAAGAQ